ncbi:MAG: DUF305 domain-containing protein [Cumulibacter sp.]
MKKIALTIASTLSALALAACGADSGSTSSAPDGDHGSHSASSDTDSGSDHSAQDVTFAQQMIPHHQQAIEMAEMVATKEVSPDLADLAGAIKDAQQPEIDQLSEWLQAWGEDLPTSGAHAGHSSMDGMMTDEQMSALDTATGGDFETMWIEMMIAHHEGAIAMAQLEVEDGINPDAVAMAQQIIDTQQSEIDHMEAMLDD